VRGCSIGRVLEKEDDLEEIGVRIIGERVWWDDVRKEKELKGSVLEGEGVWGEGIRRRGCLMGWCKKGKSVKGEGVRGF